MLKLFVEALRGLGTPLMFAFLDGIRAAFRASIIICLLAAGMSLVRGAEQRAS
ncbi:MAG: hypothetical protein M1358_02585 [Chloroflexi bacterium]|nr:hypothetical protein [Chloroflexota bacterium]